MNHFFFQYYIYYYLLRTAGKYKLHLFWVYSLNGKARKKLVETKCNYIFFDL